MNISDFVIRFETLGCRLNQIESEGAARFFVEAGFSVDLSPTTASASEDEKTILCVVNTCSVTQKAEQKARRIIRLLLKKYQNAAVIVTGCYAQLRPLEIKKIDKRIAVLGGQIKSRLTKVPEMLLEKCHVELCRDISNLNRQFGAVQNTSMDRQFGAAEFANLIEEKIFSKTIAKPGVPENSFLLATDSFLAHSRSSIKIQDGCNNNCSYCTIHIARGASVSLDVKSVLNRVQELEKAGQSEVVFTSVNIAQYRGEYNGEFLNFAKLLKLCLDSTKKINFRISSIYPEIVDDEFCEAVSDDRVCPHFHISVQSGSDKILQAMNRAYSANDVIKVCNRLRAAKQNPFLACDIITGFPGESDDDFEKTLELCKKCSFAWIHAFPFSERPGTLAAKMKNKIPQSVSSQRAERLTDFASKSKIKYIESFTGHELDAVIETKHHAVTKNFIHCEIKCGNESESKQIESLEGKLAKIRIEKPLSENIRKGGEVEATAGFVV